MSSDGFPGAVWIPAHADRYARRESRVIEEIVLHITEGGTDRAEITAHNAFGGPKYLQGGKWMAQASHYVVGRNGTVVQCVRHKDIAYHAGPAKRRGFAQDGQPISGHPKAIPATTHSSCPGRVLNWDLYMAALSDLQEIARGRTPMRLWNDDDI